MNQDNKQLSKCCGAEPLRRPLKWKECSKCGKPFEPTEKEICNQCKNCAIENTAVLGCADNDCKCHRKKFIPHKENNDWEERFDKYFDGHWGWNLPAEHLSVLETGIGIPSSAEVKEFVKIFISQTLTEERNKVMEEIKKMKLVQGKKGSTEYTRKYVLDIRNHTIDDIISLLNEEKSRYR